MRSTILLYACAILASFLMTLMILWGYPIISPDAVLYLQTAKFYQWGGWAAAAHVFPAPFYAVLIAKVSQLAHLTLRHSAILLTLFFNAAVFCAIPTLIREIGGTKPAQWIGLLLLITYHNYLMSLHTFIRDFGYWACSLWAVYFLLRFFKRPAPSLAFTWSMLTIIATLFRIEGAVFLLLAPFATTRISRYLALNLMFAASLLFLYFHGNLESGRFAEFWNDLQHSLGILHTTFISHAALIQPLIFPDLQINEVAQILVFGSLTKLLLTFIFTFSFPFLLLLIYRLKSPHFSLNASARRVFVIYILCNLITITASFVRNDVFEPRYQLGLCLLLLPLLAEPLLKAYHQNHRRWFFSIVAALMLVSFGASFVHAGPSKAYIAKSANYLSRLPASTSIYTNSAKLPFYLETENTNGWYCSSLVLALPSVKPACFAWGNLKHRPWKHFDYLVLDVSDQDDAHLVTLEKLLGKPPTKIFRGNRHGDRMIIYQLKSQSKYI